MNNNLLMGIWRLMVGLPQPLWQREVARQARGAVESLGFMSEDHHRVRDFAVRELPRVGQPLSPGFIAQELDLPLTRTIHILDELERRMTFLYRGDGESVTWAYPVTVERTPHRVTLSSGEQVYAAWAIDAIATPFVQGQLREEQLTFAVETECTHCQQPLHLEMDSGLNYRVAEDGAEPLVFVPMVDFDKLEDPSIIDAFWANSVFFWSEEHAREHRSQAGGMRGTYMTLDQAVYVTPIIQGAIFAFPRQAKQR